MCCNGSDSIVLLNFMTEKQQRLTLSSLSAKLLILLQLKYFERLLDDCYASLATNSKVHEKLLFVIVQESRPVTSKS